MEPEIGIPWTLKVTVLCAALNSCNLGYDLGITADVTPLLEQVREGLGFI